MNKLKELRKSKHLSQNEIALATGISQKTYSNYENEKAVPTINNLIKIADYFHISLDNLVNRTFEKGLSNEQVEIVNIIEQLPTYEQGQLVGYAKLMLENYKKQKENQLKNTLKNKK